MKNSLVKKALFILALLLVAVFSNGQYAIFFAIWIFTTMLLHLVRKLSRWQGFLTAFLFISIGYYIGFDFVPFLPIIVPIVITIIFSLLASIPYLIDSFFSKKSTSFLSTLIFPCAVVLIEYGYHQFNQFGTFGHFAYSQQSQIILLQSISIFGMGYITFLIAWFASVSNWILQHRNEWKKVKQAIGIYGLVLGLTLAYGGFRVQLNKTDSKTVRIASISALDSLKVMVDIQGLNNEETENEVKIETRKNTSKLNQYLFDKSITEAEAGAKVVFWAEGNGVILKEDETELYKKAGQIASRQNIYLGIAVAVIDPSNEKFLENKFIVFDKSGQKVIDYWKGISVPGQEVEVSNNKATGIQKIETEYGTIAAVICFDLDFPDYLKDASESDILLAPSNDWKEIDPIHTDMSKFRAIEQGYNFIRQTSLGLSIGTDYTGKVLSEMDHFTDSNKVMITQLPIKGAKTIYSMIGDTFIVFCLIALISVMIFEKKKSRKVNNLLKRA